MYIENLVSVIIPTYKRLEKLERAIDSVLRQTYKDIELIVVNDNEPTDDINKEINKLFSNIKDSRLKLINPEKHGNGAIARNIGIRASHGEFIAFLDDDDYWELTKIERQVEILKKLDDNWGGVSTLKKIYNKDKLIKTTLPYKSGKIYKEILMRRIEIATVSILLRRKCLDETGYFDEKLRRHQEVQLLSNFTYKYGIKLINEYLTNIDISDDINRLDWKSLITLKNDFYSSSEILLESLTKKELKDFYILHEFEIGYSMLKSKELIAGIKRCLKIFKSARAFIYAVERVSTRIRQKHFVNSRVKKYTKLS